MSFYHPNTSRKFLMFILVVDIKLLGQIFHPNYNNGNKTKIILKFLKKIPKTKILKIVRVT